MQAFLLYRFAAQQQISTLILQKFGSFYAKYNAEFNIVNRFSKSTRSGRKMAKTQAVQKEANWRRWETKGFDIGQDSAGNPIRGLLPPISIIFYFLMHKK